MSAARSGSGIAASPASTLRASGVPFSRVRAYIETCAVSSSSARARVSVHRRSVWAGRPYIRSMLRFSKPARAALATADSASAALWRRPSEASRPSSRDWTPTLRRFTPQTLARRAFYP